MTGLPYIFRWNRAGRKDEPCRLLRRSRDRLAGETVIPGTVAAAPKTFNSVLLEFADGFRLVTSGNAIRRAQR